MKNLIFAKQRSIHWFKFQNVIEFFSFVVWCFETSHHFQYIFWIYDLKTEPIWTKSTNINILKNYIISIEQTTQTKACIIAET